MILFFFLVNIVHFHVFNDCYVVLLFVIFVIPRTRRNTKNF